MDQRNPSRGLPTIYPDGKLSRSTESAPMWVSVLREWRAATGWATSAG
jgi:hypothetical protein